jgi:hypothetical protein
VAKENAAAQEGVEAGHAATADGELFDPGKQLGVDAFRPL